MNESKKPIIFFNSVNSWGGGEKWHFETALRMKELGNDVVIFCSKNSELHQKAVMAKITVELIDVKKFSYLNPLTINQLQHQIRAIDPSSIIMNLSSDVKVAGMAAKKAGVSRIIYRRGSAIPLKNHLLNRHLFKNVVTDILANSEETKATINLKANLMAPEKIKVIYNGIKFSEYNLDANPIYQRQNDEFVFGNAGRLVYQKNQVDLILLASRLEKEGVNFKFLIAGCGHLERDLRSLIEKRKLTHRFEWLGFVENMDSFYNSIDAFVLTSRWEGFGYVLVEAAYFNKPIIAYRISSNPELVIEGKTGLLSEIYQIDKLAGNCLQLIQQKDLTKELGKNGHEWVKENFEFNKNIQLLQDWLS